MVFEASVVASFAVVIFLVVGYFQRTVIDRRVQRLVAQIERSKPSIAVVGLQPAEISEAIGGDIDRVQMAVTVLSVLPTLVLIVGGRPVVTILMLIAYITVGASVLFWSPSRKLLNWCYKAAGRKRIFNMVRHLPIDSDRSLICFGILIGVMILVLGANVIDVVEGGGAA